MLPIDDRTLRLFLHVVAATVWVGGQVTLAFVVGIVRGRGGPELARAVARRFQQVAWPTYAVLLATGTWNLFAVNLVDQDREYLTTLFVKLALVLASGAFAAWHALLTGPAVARAAGQSNQADGSNQADEAEVRRRRALSGISAFGGLVFALAAAFFGVVLRG